MDLGLGLMLCGPWKDLSHDIHRKLGLGGVFKLTLACLGGGGAP